MRSTTDTPAAASARSGESVQFQAVIGLTIATDGELPPRIHAILTVSDDGDIALRLADGLLRQTMADVLLWAYDLVLAREVGTHAYLCGLGSVRVAA